MRKPKPEPEALNLVADPPATPLPEPEPASWMPGTAHRTLFAALCRPFPREVVRTRDAGRGKMVPYITARDVQNRLDEVLGPENWEVRFRALSQESVVCTLTITLPDGRPVTKEDVGANSRMSEQTHGKSDPGDDEKGAASDGLKRVAVQFGIGRELYGVATVDYAPPPEPAPEKPEPTGPYDKWAHQFLRWANFCYVKKRVKEDPSFRFPGEFLLVVRDQLTAHLYAEVVKAGRAVAIPGDGPIPIIEMAAKVRPVFEQDGPWCHDRAVELMTAAGREHKAREAQANGSRKGGARN